MRYFIQIALIILFCAKLNAQEHKLVLLPDADQQVIELKTYQNFVGDSLEINQKLKDLIENFQNVGFLAASIDTTRFLKDEVFAKLHVGKRYLWNDLDLNSLDKELLDKFDDEVETDNFVDIRSLDIVKTKTLEHYNNTGYPFSKVYFNDIAFIDSNLTAKLKIEKGPYYAVDSIHIKGGARTSYTFIKKTLEINQGDAFNQEKINQIAEKINNIPFLSEIKPAEIEFKQETVDLYLYLQNSKANMFNGIIGFLPDEDGKLMITGELALGLVNSFGRGEEIFLNWEKLESSSQKLDLGFSYPYIFKSNFGIDLDFELFKKDSSFLSLNSGVGIRLFLDHDDYIKAYYRYKSSSRIGNDKDQVISSNFADINSSVIGVSYFSSKVDYKFNPRKGYIFNVFGGAGFKSIRNQKSLDSLNFDQNTTEVEAGLDLDIYLPVYGNFVFHFGSQTRYLDQFSDDNRGELMFENELFRFGGAQTLRGFDESIFLASIYSLQNVEIKYLFDKNSSFYAFWNGAYYYKEISEGVTEDFPWGFGIGLNFDTKAGIFSLSYALGKQFDNPFQVQSAKIHFGYISRF